MTDTSKKALIVGASRGLGLGLARAYLKQGWRVIATQRAVSDGLLALHREAGDRLVVEDLDVTDDDAIVALRQRHAHETLDLLFVSAGVNIASDQHVGAVPLETFNCVMATNTLAPLRIIEMFADLVPPTGAVAAMTSVLGSVGDNTTGGYEVYRASKAALNTLLRSFAVRHPKHTILALHPGWVRTDMGGPKAAVSVDDSVAGLVATIAARQGQPGCAYLDYQGKTLSW